MTGPRHHIVIPDTQVKPGVRTDHLEWIGRYIVDQFAGKDIVVIHLGDHWDMPSLSSYDKGKKSMEGRRYVADIAAGNRGFHLISDPIDAEVKRRRGRWAPRRVFLHGNHEDRISRAIECDPSIEGALSLDQLDTCGWETYPFLKPVDIDGIIYCHYLANPMTGRPYGGLASTRLKQVGRSFTQGHQQTLDYSVRYVLPGKSQHALIAGACYLHDEEYRGFQGNALHWRGIVACHDVKAGSYNPMFIDLDYLKRRYA